MYTSMAKSASSLSRGKCGNNCVCVSGCLRESVETLVSVTWMSDVVLYTSMSKWMSDLYKEK